mgnify:CR=1 FL=1
MKEVTYDYYKPRAWAVVLPRAAPELAMEGIKDAQDLIAYCARVSNPANQYNQETGEKLIRYLIRHKHWSPLEMVSVTLGLDTARDISHQIVRHRSFKFQEFSQRYADPESMGDAFLIREARLGDPKNRQNSISIDDDKLQRDWAVLQMSVISEAQIAYKWAIERGIAKECARVVLPEGLTKTRVFMAGDIRSWVHYLETRTDPSTQNEHLELARCLADVISTVFPMTREFVK